MARTNENYLRWKFGEWVAKGYTANVALVEPGGQTSAQLEPGESAIALIEVHSDTMPLLLTDARLVRGNDTIVRFTEVESCNWIDRDPAVAAAQKTTGYQRLILDVNGGRVVVIHGLEQAVFPLLKFFCNKLGRRPKRRRHDTD